MVAESALLVRYQVSVGVLYQDLGILLTLFMAGLVIGSLAVSHLAVNRYLGRLLPRGLGIALLVAFSALAVILARVTPSSVIASTALVGGALLLTGALVAALFAYASVDPVDDASRIISPLYAADLLGGCIGSLAASLVLIPLAGIDHTWFGMTFVAIAALALF
jgi:predicted membrane-bound spermidine synthase